MSEPASTAFITVGVAIGEISTLPAAHEHDFSVKSMLLKNLRFLSEKDNHVAHAHRRNADMNLFQ
jgi:hypothetical protein